MTRDLGSRKRIAHYGVAIATILGLACVIACDSGRTGTAHSTEDFAHDASAEAPNCQLQCSLDGRSIIEACTGRIVETCRPETSCGAATCMEPCAAAALGRSSNGCEFYFQPPLFDVRFPTSCYAAFIVNTSLQPVELSLELEGNGIDASKSMFRTEPGSAALIEHTGAIAPGESVVLFLSDLPPDMTATARQSPEPYIGCPSGVVPAAFTGFSGGTKIGSSFRLTTNVPVALSTIYPFGGALSFRPSATLVLPVATWAKENIIVNGWEVANGHRGPSAQIVASEDDTEVTIIPIRDIQNGQGVKGGRARRPVKYRLDKAQHLQLVQDEELSGSFVSSNKPTTIFGGHACADIPSTVAACEILAQQIPAFEQWGSEYVGVGYRPRTGNEHEVMSYRMVAARDGTQFDYDPAIPPGAPVTINAGEVTAFKAGTGDAFVVRTQDADHPIYLAAYMTGGEDYGGRGDPEFVNVVPAVQYLNAYSFYADPTYPETSLVVVRASTGGQFKDVWLECAGNLTGWRAIGSRGNYEYVRVDLSRGMGPGDTFGASVCRHGLQRMRSDGPFTATLWGWGQYASYAYPGGMAHRKLVTTPLLPIQ